MYQGHIRFRSIQRENFLSHSLIKFFYKKCKTIRKIHPNLVEYDLEHVNESKT